MKQVQHNYEAYPAEILAIKDLSHDTRYFKMRFTDPKIQEKFSEYKPGQFVLFSIFGVGEATFSISSTPTRPEFMEFGVRKVGSFTEALFELKEGDTVDVRGPYGNGFDMESMKGKDLVIVSGGLGAVPLRSVLLYAEDKREEFNEVYFLNGARSPADMLYKNDFLGMHSRNIIETHLTVDNDPTGEWEHNVGVVTTLFSKIADKVDTKNAYGIMCGPPIMYKFVMQEFLKLGIPKDKILMTLERRMKCGQGHCGHCAIGARYTCLDGPVFTYWDYERLEELI